MEYSQDTKYFRADELKHVKEPKINTTLKKVSRKVIVRIFIIALFVVALYLAWLQIRKDDTFLVTKIEISGCEFSDSRAIAFQLKNLKGKNLFDIDIKEISEKLKHHHWIRECTVVRSIPETINVYIEEYTPVAIANIAGRYFIIANEGDVIDLYNAGITKIHLPIINLSNETSNSSARYKVSIVGKMLEKIRDENPIFYPIISEIVFNEQQVVGFILNNDNNILLLNSDDNGGSLKKYLGLYKEIKGKYPLGVVIDLRFNDQVVIKQEMRNI
jgi:hypothetical protein